MAARIVRKPHEMKGPSPRCLRVYYDIEFHGCSPIMGSIRSFLQGRCNSTQQCYRHFFIFLQHLCQKFSGPAH
jgi:hypothetical protein